MAESLSTLRAKYAEILAANDWEIFDKNPTVYVSLSGDAELWRALPELSPDYIAEFTDLLNRITDIKNEVECSYVDDPEAGGETFEGRWRQAYIRRIAQGDVTKLVQVLRKGYAQSIYWTEARVKGGKFLQDQPTVGPDGVSHISSDEKYLEVYWPNLAPEKVQAMVDGLNASTFTNPVVQEETRTGVWHNLVVAPSVADDGSGVITLSLAMAEFRLDGFAAWLTHRTENIAYLWGYAKDEAQAVANAWKAAGRSCTFSYSKESGLVDIILRERDFDPLTVGTVTASWNCRYKEVADYYFGVSDPTLYPLITTPVNGISYDRTLRDNADGSWDIIIITRNVQYRDIAFQNSAIDATSTTTTRQQLGLTTQDAESITSTSGAVLSQRVEVRDDCSKDVITNKDTGTAQTSYVRVASPSGTSTTTIKTVQSSALGAPASATGHIKRNEDRASKYPDRFDTSEMDEVPTNQSATSTDKSAASTATKVLNTEGAALGVPAPAAGTIIKQEAQPTEAGNVRTIQNTIVVSNQTAVSTDMSYASESVKTLNTENSALSTPAKVKGSIFRQESSPTESGKNRTVEETITQYDQYSISIDKSAAFKNTKTLHTENSTDLTEPTISQGNIYRQESSPTEAGNQRTIEQIVASVPLSVSFPSLRTASSSENTYAYRNQLTKLSAPDHVQGSTYAATNQHNDDDTYDGVVRIRASIQGISSRTASDNCAAKEIVWSYQSYRTNIDVPDSFTGTIFSSRIVKNEDDTYSGDVSSVESKQQRVAFSSLITGLRAESTDSYKNREDQEALDGATVAGLTETLNIKVNDDCTFDSVKITRLALPGTTAFTSLISPVGTSTESVYRNKISPVSAGIASTNIGSYRVTNRQNDDLTYDGEVVYSQPPESARVLNFTSESTVMINSSATVYEFLRSKLDAPLSPIGSLYQARCNLQDDGTYTGSLVYQAGIPLSVAQFESSYSDDTLGYSLKGKNFASLPTITDEANTLLSLRAEVNELGSYDYSIDKTLVRGVPLSADDGATWNLYDSGYSWRLWFGSNIIRAQRRLRSFKQNFYRTEAEAISAIEGADTDSTHSRISDFLWKSVRAVTTEDVVVYSV